MVSFKGVGSFKGMVSFLVILKLIVPIKFESINFQTIFCKIHLNNFFINFNFFINVLHDFEVFSSCWFGSIDRKM